MYPSPDRFNSQINHQQSGASKNLEAQLTYMTPENFMRHCIFYLSNGNRLNIFVFNKYVDKALDQ